MTDESEVLTNVSSTYNENEIENRNTDEAKSSGQADGSASNVIEIRNDSGSSSSSVYSSDTDSDCDKESKANAMVERNKNPVPANAIPFNISVPVRYNQSHAVEIPVMNNFSIPSSSGITIGDVYKEPVTQIINKGADPVIGDRLNSISKTMTRTNKIAILMGTVGCVMMILLPLLVILLSTAHDRTTTEVSTTESFTTKRPPTESHEFSPIWSTAPEEDVNEYKLEIIITVSSDDNLDEMRRTLLIRFSKIFTEKDIIAEKSDDEMVSFTIAKIRGYSSFQLQNFLEDSRFPRIWYYKIIADLISTTTETQISTESLITDATTEWSTQSTNAPSKEFLPNLEKSVTPEEDVSEYKLELVVRVMTGDPDPKKMVTSRFSGLFTEEDILSTKWYKNRYMQNVGYTIRKINGYSSSELQKYLNTSKLSRQWYYKIIAQ